MVTRYGPYSNILENMRVAVEVSCFSHREIAKSPINPGQCAHSIVGCIVSPCAVRLSDPEDTRKRGTEEGCLSRITVSEGLIPSIESSFLWLANIEVTRNHKGFRRRVASVE